MNVQHCVFVLPGDLLFNTHHTHTHTHTHTHSLLPAIMQHRRTVSDTLLFRRPSVLEELKKDAPNSSHSSRSATPLLALLQPGSTTGEGSVVGQPPGAKVTPQHSPQQQKIVSAREVRSLILCMSRVFVFCMCTLVLCTFSVFTRGVGILWFSSFFLSLYRLVCFHVHTDMYVHAHMN